MDADRLDRWSRSLADSRLRSPRGPGPTPRLEVVARTLSAAVTRRGVLGALLAAALAPRLPASRAAARQEVACPCPDPPCLLHAWGSAGNGPGQFHLPSGTAVAADGTVYVADRNNHRIQAFDAAGAFLRTWGTEGTGVGQFRSPLGVAVAPDGMVYVADVRNHRIQAFCVAP
jgi:hypothetical protein